MKCPRTFKTTDDNYGNLYINGADCLKEECEWWSKELNQCDPTGLLLLLKGIAENMANLVNKMPYPRAPEH